MDKAPLFGLKMIDRSFETLSSEPLVSVVIPAYQAEATLAETLASVQAQTHRTLEIIVVDDGSSDETAAVAEKIAMTDRRIRVMRQANGGVARARNAGLAASTSEFVAFVDADDLWRPNKIEHQLRALVAGGESAGLAYTWSAVIDDENRIVDLNSDGQHTGDVLAMLCFGNFLGNGSCVLVRRRYLLEIGGFDPELRDAKAQGCEDWKAYFQLAERSLFVLVPDYLTGYRQTAAAMSGDVRQMLRSDQRVRQEIAARHPEYLENVKHGRIRYIEWLLRREVGAGNLENTRELLNRLREARGPTLRVFLRRMKLTAKCRLNHLRPPSVRSDLPVFLPPARDDWQPENLRKDVQPKIG